jgi:hypothetical protein
MKHSSKTPEARMRELEYEMERHKARFMAASRQGVDAFRRDLSVITWVGSYPVQAAMIAFVGGLCLGFTKSLDRRQLSSLR